MSHQLFKPRLEDVAQCLVHCMILTVTMPEFDSCFTYYLLLHFYFTRLTKTNISDTYHTDCGQLTLYLASPKLHGPKNAGTQFSLSTCASMNPCKIVGYLESSAYHYLNITKFCERLLRLHDQKLKSITTQQSIGYQSTLNMATYCTGV